MKNPYLLPVLFLCLVCILPSCENDKVTEHLKFYSSEDYQILSAKLDLPEQLYAYSNFEFSGDHQTNSIGTLGRVLFYDVNLSSDNSVSCASCHKQSLAFSDDVPLSTGILNRTTSRNSLALGVFRSFGDYSEDPSTTLFWDGRVDNLHDQMRQTIANPNEMGMEVEEVLEKIKDLDYYRILSMEAFGSETLNQFTMLNALEVFMSSIKAGNSKFDEVAIRNPIFTNNPIDWQGFTPQENLGKNLFQNNCSTCHSQSIEEVFKPNATGKMTKTANNGLDLVYTDKGAGEFDASPEAIGIFKIPALRNIELTAPYMHDGRFGTLEEVINFYSVGIQDHANLSDELKANGHPKKFNFTQSEKDALVDFLHTLTDHTMKSEVKWSDPFL